jgi:hypothetical protein
MKAYWIRQKFNQAVKRRQEARLGLANLFNQRNPHSTRGHNYTHQFFENQWTAQRAFRVDHSDVEEARMKEMAALYERENVLDLLRWVHLNSPGEDSTYKICFQVPITKSTCFCGLVSRVAQADGFHRNRSQ